MIAKLRAWNDILYRDDMLIKIRQNNHYMKFYYKDKQALGFRDFYLKYWKGDRLVEVRPKKDRKKNIIPDKFEVYGKRGNYVFTAYRHWFEWIDVSECIAESIKKKADTNAYVKPKPRDVARKRALVNLPWDALFEV